MVNPFEESKVTPEQEIQTLINKKNELIAGGHTEEEALEILGRAVEDVSDCVYDDRFHITNVQGSAPS